MLKKTLSIALVIILAFTTFLVIPAVAEDDIILNKEAEDYGSSNVGEILEDSIYCLEGSGIEYLCYGQKVTMTEGWYTAVIYMAIEEKSTSNANVVTLDCTTPNEEGQPVVRNLFEVRDSMFGTTGVKTGKYVAVQNDFHITGEAEYEVRLMFRDVTTVRVDRIMIVKQGTPIDEPNDILSLAPDRPADAEVVDSYDVPLNEENVKFGAETSGECVDGRVEFRKMYHTGGSIEGLAEPIYLSNGQKTAQFYLRLPESNSGTFPFLVLTVIEDGLPIAYQRITCDDFSGYANQVVCFSYTFTADENCAMDFKLAWRGNYDLIVDKVLFTDEATLDIEPNIKQAPETTDGYAIEFTPADLTVDGMTSINTYKIKVGNNFEFLLPAPYLQEWFNAGYTKVRFSFTTPEEQLGQALQDEAQAYDAEVTELALYDFEVTLIQDENETSLISLPNSIEMHAILTNEIIMGFSDSRKLGLCYQESQDGSIDLINSTLENRQRYVTLLTKNTGAIIANVADIGK